MLINQTSVTRLKEEVLERAGIKIPIPGMCRHLSLEISRVSGSMISETTIKRVFGFATRHYELSLFTLNALTVFAGYSGWDEFLKKNEPPESGGDVTAHAQEVLHFHCKERTLHFIKNFLRQSKVHPAHLVTSQTIILRLDQFLGDSESLTTIVRASGAGKSAGIIAWALQYFERQVDEQQPVLLMVNANQLYSFLNNDISLEDWLETFLALPPGITISQHSLLLIFDSFDERSFPKEKLNILYLRLKEACLRDKEQTQLRIALITRPSVWSTLMQSDKTSFPFPREMQFQLLFSANEDGTDRNDVFECLVKAGLTRSQVLQLEDQVITLLCYPLYLQDFLMAYRGSEGQTEKALKWLMDAIYRHLEDSLKFSHYPKQKRAITKLICDKRNTSFPIQENEIVPDTEHVRSLEELLDEFIVKEERSADIFCNEWPLTFCSKAIAGYFSAQYSSQSNADDFVPPDANVRRYDPLLSAWVLRWRLYHLFASDVNVEEAATDAIEILQRLSPEQQVEAFEFILHLHDISSPWTGVLSTIANALNIIDSFFREPVYQKYLAASKQHFLKVLITICRDDRKKNDLFCLLFLSLLLENDKKKIRDMNVLKRLTEQANTLYQERMVLMENLTDMFLYKIFQQLDPEFLDGCFNHALQMYADGRRAEYFIHQLLLQLYLESSRKIQPEICSKRRQFKVETQGILKLPFLAMLVARYDLNNPSKSDTGFTQRNEADSEQGDSDIFRCLQLSLTCDILRTSKKFKEAQQTKNTIFNIAAACGWQWFIPGNNNSMATQDEQEKRSSMDVQDKFNSA